MTDLEHFNSVIDAHLAGDSIPPQTPEEQLAADIIMFAQGFELSSESDAAIIQQLKAVSPHQRVQLPFIANRSLRVASVSIGLMALMVLGVLTVPPLRALAQDLLRQIGRITVSDAPSYYDVYSQQPTISPNSTPIPDITPQIYENRLLSLDEVSRLADFTVYAPSYLPARYRIGSRDLWQSDGLKSVTTSYHNPITYDGLSISQSIYAVNEPDQTRQFPVGDAEMVDVMVRGVGGLWVEGVTTWPEGSTLNMLFWQEGDFTFMLQTSRLSQAEMIRIAESLE